MTTALAEVRPWIGAYVTVAEFTLLKDLTLVHCRPDDAPTSRDPTRYVDPPSYWSQDEPSPDKREEVVWSEIDHAFAKPVTPTDRTAEYAPTQILADLFRAAGYDGVAYGSALGHGLNIALFDIDAAEVTRCELFQTLNVTFTFSDSFAFRPIL